MLRIVHRIFKKLDGRTQLEFEKTLINNENKIIPVDKESMAVSYPTQKYFYLIEAKRMKEFSLVYDPIIRKAGGQVDCFSGLLMRSAPE